MRNSANSKYYSGRLKCSNRKSSVIGNNGHLKRNSVCEGTHGLEYMLDIVLNPTVFVGAYRKIYLYMSKSVEKFH
jgi:hypothetical protein